MENVNFTWWVYEYLSTALGPFLYVVHTLKY